MKLLTLYKKESKIPAGSALTMALISGTAQGLLLAIISRASSTASSESLNFRMLLLFLSTFAIMIIGKRFALRKATEIAENITFSLRLRISKKIINSDLKFIEETGKGEIYAKISGDTNLISESGSVLINACQSGIVLAFSLLYIAYLSKAAFTITIIAIGMSIFKFLLMRSNISRGLRKTMNKEESFFDMLNQILDGFKELKQNSKKRDAFFKIFSLIAKKTEQLKLRTGYQFVTEMMFSQVFFYTLLAIIIFILPRLELANGELILHLVAAILFIIGPANLMVSAIPIFSRVEMAIDHLYELEQQIDDSTRDEAPVSPLHTAIFESFKKIHLENAMYSYLDKHKAPLFTIGPNTLSFSKGEICFIVGGNGSGKTSFLKLLIGLYYPDEGSIKVDETIINSNNYTTYRELFTVICNDFYLFSRLYGIETIDPDEVNRLIKLMKLENKTTIIDDEFTNTSLSTGQRKRLAMIVSILEQKQIIILDEWAADQDPEFRHFFYEELLRDLKKKGKTIIAVCHDDRYFHVADRVLKMEYGKFTNFE
jgi:putative pyoverdin transport system ATP-binding/permease protein